MGNPDFLEPGKITLGLNIPGRSINSIHPGEFKRFGLRRSNRTVIFNA